MWRKRRESRRRRVDRPDVAGTERGKDSCRNDHKPLKSFFEAFVFLISDHFSLTIDVPIVSEFSL